MRKVIINADDLGMSRTVNAKIEEFIHCGYITSCSLMANAPEFEDGVRIVMHNPQVSVGVHLNIIEFSPLTNADIFKKYNLLDQEGCFVDGAAFVAHYSPELLQAFFEEWDAQISKIEEMGIKPSHCDSHQHIHTIDALQDVLCRVLDKHNINRVRRRTISTIGQILRARLNSDAHNDKNKITSQGNNRLIYRRLHYFVKRYQCYKWNKMMGTSYKLADDFFSYKDYCMNWKLCRYSRRNNVTEIMCHPGNELFDYETSMLMDGHNWMDEGFQPIPYYNL